MTLHFPDSSKAFLTFAPCLLTQYSKYFFSNVYLFLRERERERTSGVEAERERERETQNLKQVPRRRA